jgi:hypothetical protein
MFPHLGIDATGLPADCHHLIVNDHDHCQITPGHREYSDGVLMRARTAFGKRCRTRTSAVNEPGCSDLDRN